MRNFTRVFLLLVALTIATPTSDNFSKTNNSLPLNTQPNRFDNITGGNRLWNGLLHDCQPPTMSCVQKNVYHFLDETFGYRGDVKVGEYFQFKRNTVDYTKYTKNANTPDEDTEDEAEERSMSPLEEVTKALHKKSVNFLMTHDTEIKLPEMLFQESTLKVSPRSFEGDGILVKLDLIPREIQENGTGRILFKKIKKFFKNKLISALMSILLVISLIKAKLMFLMPMVMGVGTAKKVLLKVLLFLFPALSHLFKLCSYYHATYQKTKYHHHHHQIAHIHHSLPTPPHHLPEIHISPDHHHGPPDLHHGPPDLHHGPPDHHHHPYKHEMDAFEYSGPGLGPEYISNRNAFDHTPSMSDENEIKSWGLGQAQGHKGVVRRGHQPKPAILTPPSVNQIDQLALQAEKEVLLKTRLQQEHQRIRQENLKLQEQLKLELKMQEQLKLQTMMLMQHKTKLQPQLVPPHVVHMQPQLQPHLLQQNMHTLQMMHTTPMTPTKMIYDPFYSPILDKIDKIFNNIGFIDEPCRERLVCSMYKNPTKFSPHSNLLSAELSRDSKDLQKPTSSNEAVVRFYRYVQAARDGQDHRECLRLYPSCNINTEL